MTDYSHWHVGMKVVCVKHGKWEIVSGFDRIEAMPIEGGIYQIQSIVADDDGVFITLDECSPTAFWSASRFRPLVARKTDISVFTEILRKVEDEQPRPSKQEIEAAAWERPLW